ncbi:MAG: BamA/TamA family outer membrane protein, partial [Planctomycetes bacterium]|nr:BamA/TamA family outer membrane protein [Planctomycetota bacterium]
MHPADEALARGLVGVRVGTALDTAALDGAVTRLLRSGRFLGARYRLEEERGGVRVVFDLSPRLWVTTIRFEGNEEIREAQLRKRITQKPGSPRDRVAVEEGRDALIAMYHAEGYRQANVTYDAELLERTGELVYRVSEGEQVRIRRVAFEGNDSIDAGTLKRRIESKKAFWIFRSGAFDEDRAEGDVIRLRSYYRDEGFLDVRVRRRLDPNPDGKGFALLFTINEGVRYVIEAIEVRGNRSLSEAELLGMISSRVGEVVKRAKVDTDATAIRTLYGELGYIYVAVRAVQVFSNTPGFVRIIIDIDEGEQFRVGRVVVRGNARTRDKVVRRALNLYPPDDLFDMTEVNEARRRLMSTQIFSSVRVYPVGDAPGVRDIIIDVEEADKAGDFIFGAGVTSNNGLIGNIVLDMKNFDLADKPRTWSELLRLRSFFGGGQRLRIELQPGTLVSRYRLDFTEPYFMEKPIRFDFNAYLFRRFRDDYDERRGGTAISFGKRFERGTLRSWTGEIAFRAEEVSIGSLDFGVPQALLDVEGSNLETSIKVAIARDRTDNRHVPTAGDRLRLSYEQFGIFGGDEIYAKARADYTWFNTLSTDHRGRKRVLQLHVGGGAITGDAPVYNRFFAGGTGSIRGFDFRGVGEHKGLAKTNIGGDFMLLSGAEYSFPLIGDSVRGLVFLDTGIV